MRAGLVSEVIRTSGDWLFVDIGFARDKATCGLLLHDGEAQAVTFAQLKGRVLELVSLKGSPLNLVIEAPLSVAFTKDGNPTGRSMEKRDLRTRYWYVGLGCTVLVAATYLVKAIAHSKPNRAIRLFEGFVSFKEKGAASCHTDDVMCLRDVVWHPDRHPGAITPPERIGLREADRVTSAFDVLGLDVGIPPVINATAGNATTHL